MGNSPIFPKEFIEYYTNESGLRCVRVVRGHVLDIGRQLTDDGIFICEEEMGVRLPVEYRQWLLWCNGGIPRFVPDDQAWFLTIEDSSYSKMADSVDRLWGIDQSGKESSSDLRYHQCKRHRFFPSHCISIGKANFDDPDRFFLLSVSGDDLGTVYDFGILRDESRRKHKFNTVIRITKLAHGFSEFWNSLTGKWPGPRPNIGDTQ